MLPELKAKLDQQYAELYPPINWAEIIGSIACAIGFIAFTYFWFKYL